MGYDRSQGVDDTPGASLHWPAASVVVDGSVLGILFREMSVMNNLESED